MKKLLTQAKSNPSISKSLCCDKEKVLLARYLWVLFPLGQWLHGFGKQEAKWTVNKTLWYNTRFPVRQVGLQAVVTSNSKAIR